MEVGVLPGEPPWLGFKAKFPQNAAGRMIEPPTWVPMAAGNIRSHGWLSDEDPPAVRAGSKGFVVGPG